jgi:hypothetical protein
MSIVPGSMLICSRFARTELLRTRGSSGPLDTNLLWKSNCRVELPHAPLDRELPHLADRRRCSGNQSKMVDCRLTEKPQASILPCLILFMHDFRDAEEPRADLQTSAFRGKSVDFKVDLVCFDG